jgi:predicted CoA-substrate-specific enzyme activase
MNHEYSKWPEGSWASPGIDLGSAEKIAAGVDVGTTSTQAAVICDGALCAYANIRTGWDFARSAREAMDRALQGAGIVLADIPAVCATGFGRSNVSFATRTMDEVHCHAKGARHLFGDGAVTVVDLGAQTCKAILLHGWDRVRSFEINDKCATGMGRNIESLCSLLEIPITEIGAMSLDVVSDPEPVSNTCFAYAQTETMGLFRPVFREEMLTENEICAMYLFAVAWRVMGAVGKLQPLDVGDLHVEGGLAFTGGLAKNPGVTKRLERDLGTTALTSEIDPMLAGAVGAALLA